VLSVRNRGTAERPGLALGLARGGACRGIAFRVDGHAAEATRECLWEREMSTRAYDARTLLVRLLGDADGRRVPALVFVSRRDHPQYCGDLEPEAAARLVAQGEGSYGTALDYLRSTVRHLDDFGVRDGPLHRVLALAERLAANG
jgi:cation transport protein ChaC